MEWTLLNMPILRLMLGVLLAFAAAVQSVHAEKIYTWVDEFGVTHFSRQQPPDLIQAIKIDTVARIQPIQTNENDDWLMTLCPDGIKRNMQLERESVERQYQEKLKFCREDHAQGLLLSTLSQCYGEQQRWRTEELHKLELNKC